MSRARILPLAALLAIPFCAAAGRAATVSRIVFAADRTPSVSGEIYRLLPSGRRIDLSRSPYQDTHPAVSTDGKRVAFVSDRSGTASVYEVGINGRGLAHIGPSLSPLAEGGEPTPAWQPGGRRLALVGSTGRTGMTMSLWILRRGHAPLKLLRSKSGVSGPWWSPDGRVLTASPSPGIVRAFSASGHQLWKADGYCCGSWSAQDLFAVGLGNNSGLVVYDSQGHRRFATPGGTLSSDPSWSPTGDQVAAILGARLDVWTAQGRLVLSRQLAEVHPFPGSYTVIWATESRVIVVGFATCGCRAKSVDIRTGKVSSASGRWVDPLSADRKLAIVTTPRPLVHSGPRFSIRVAPTNGGPGRTYARVPGCWSSQAWQAGVGALQFAGRSIVYESRQFCDEPFANLYSVASDGSGVKRLTNVLAQETQPALSPDGNQIAYVWASLTGLSCAGCSDGIRIASARGKAVRTLTNPQNCTFDDSPSWSPDGTQILYSESSCDTFGELFTVPAGGGTPHDLGIAGREPAWGPSRIAYVGSSQSNHGLWTTNPDGSDPVKVANSGAWPAWSPDGRLAYLVGTTLVVGSTSVALPFAQVTSLAWLPDGTGLLVTARTKANSPADDLYTISTSGTNPVRLTKNYGVLGAHGA